MAFVRYKRSLEVDSFRETYLRAKDIMRKFYYFRKEFYGRSTFSYYPDRVWVPEYNQSFSQYLEAAWISLQSDLTTREIISSLVDYRRFCVKEGRDVKPLNEEFFLWEIDSAVEFFIQEKVLYEGSRSYTESRIPDPAEELEKKRDLQEYSWGLIREVSKDDLEALERIYAFGQEYLFEEEFLIKKGFREFQEKGIKEGFLMITDGRVVWKS